jgi:hypothetical protein
VPILPLIAIASLMQTLRCPDIAPFVMVTPLHAKWSSPR